MINTIDTSFVSPKTGSSGISLTNILILGVVLVGGYWVYTNYFQPPKPKQEQIQ